MTIPEILALCNSLTDFVAADDINLIFCALIDSFAATKLDVLQIAHGFSVSEWVYNNAGVYTKAIATGNATSNVVGVVSEVDNLNNFVLQVSGLNSFTTWSQNGGFAPLDGNSQYYLSTSTAGALTTTEPNAPNFSKPLLQSHTTLVGNVNIELGVVGPVA